MNGTLDPKAASELRHELRTPINHIIGYAEMLREDCTDGSPDAATIDRIIGVAREVLALINAALPPTGIATLEDLSGLLADLATPQETVLAATTVLLEGAHDAQFVADVERIAQAVRRLTAVPVPSALTGARESGPYAGTGTAGAAATVRAAGAAPDVAITPHSTSARAGSKGRILIVDDVEENRAVLARRLEREGYDIDSAANGEDALRKVAQDGFDLVLLDVLMPGMDGFAVLERITGNPDTRSIPVIMISALDDLASVVRCIEHGAEDYLTKPFDPVLLRARIGASLEKKRWHDREADYLRQVTRVIEAASAVELGTYAPGALAGVTGRDDELGRLARVFDAMAAGVHARESRLREQLRELQSDVSLATTEYEAMHQSAVTDGGDALAVGSVLGDRYEIRGVLGTGGMGVVYRARDRKLEEDVAVKTIRRELLTGDAVLAERFMSEIRLARRISHRNVVRTHDLGDADGQLFVTMELVQGLTVRELLMTRGKLGVASTLALARQFTEALAVAHAAGVIHRDVKPENALIDGDGVLKVMDFGIARLAEATSTRTQSGLIVGTPAYMAPEQLVGEEVDARADLYALGVVIYECLTGTAPFQAPSAVALIARVLTVEPVPPARENPDVPPALSALVMQLLSKAAAQRPASAAVLLEQLAELG